MGHHISAIIGDKNVNKEKIKEYGLAAAFENEYVIVIFELEAMCQLAEILDLSIKEKSEHLDWDCDLTMFLAKEIGMKKFALIQTDYFGGFGEQYAAYFENGEKVLHNVTINEALKELGVRRSEELDEFDTINLGEYRHAEYYYWDDGNFADKKENMIPGRVIKSK
ncbi:hypothetical protein [Aureivirga sp. CE67]|uniref:hypothetical protein n=1 Tax=Aureivirga sp. CE67 TaxID=1788983 RepID=UPI0018CA69AB|nr:hypothetical protein [Aureivirga sp. CE67]